MNGDEQLLNGRVHGAEHGDPNPGSLPHRTYAERVGGPLDGLLPDIQGRRTAEVDDGVALSAKLSRWPGGRALNDPRPGEPRTPGPGTGCRLSCSGDTPSPQAPTTAPAAPITGRTT
ncbi:hypothetical protein [Streptomyces sp. NPDC093260]|uniref:hypothetical protein n=1 Tax=Streptomyces sp. NPDC093260 TaxID=3155073 RepID=UPI00343880E4